MVNLNYCVICGKWLGTDDYDGICVECDEQQEMEDEWAEEVADEELEPEDMDYLTYGPRDGMGWGYQGDF